MSEDGHTMIIKGKDGKYRGYSCWASMDYPTKKSIEEGYLEFTANSLEEAIKKAQKEHHEYGYSFYNL